MSVRWTKPVWVKTDRGFSSIVGHDVNGERYTVELSKRPDGFWYASFGESQDRPDRRVESGPFATLVNAKQSFKHRTLRRRSVRSAI